MSFPPRVLCETIRDFIAKIEKACDRSLENTVETDTLASKVRILEDSLLADLVNLELCFRAKLTKVAFSLSNIFQVLRRGGGGSVFESDLRIFKAVLLYRSPYTA